MPHNSQNVIVKRALISVSDKTGVVEFAKQLKQHNIEILSTGGTAALLQSNNVEVTDVSDYTGFPEMMDGRVKTLHPKVHGGILGRRGVDDEVMARHSIQPIDMVVVNLYPFEQTVRKPDCTLTQAIENIDIGGPTLLRAAAKNHAAVVVVVDTNDYNGVLEEIGNDGVSANTRFNLAISAFEHTARYDGGIANYLGAITEDQDNAKRTEFSRTLSLQFRKSQSLRYGENPHQRAAFYVEHSSLDLPLDASVATAKQLQGKALSYNNIADTDAALECVKQFSDEAACVIVKHANPCGVALAKPGQTLINAYQRAFKTDPESAFGGIIAFNRELDSETAKAIVAQQFVEVIVAPSITPAAQQAIATKGNVRLLSCGEWNQTQQDYMEFKRIRGGLLAQDADLDLYQSLQIASERKPSDEEKRDLLFAWRVAKFVKSNAIVYAKDNMTIGVGAGQMSRINSARIAAIKAEHAALPVAGAVMASDAFFPFRDGIDAAADVGITAIIQPGGSMRDDDTIKAADEHGIAMIFTAMRHFRH